MHRHTFTRRTVFLGMLAMPGCTALTRLNAAATPRDTFDLRPPRMDSAGPRTRRTLLVAAPTAPAALDTDRILIRPGRQSIAYLPDARWSDDLPKLLQSLLVRTLSSTERVGFVGIPNAGPIPDRVLLTRIDRFDVDASQADALRAVISFEATVLRDSDQQIIATRNFTAETQLRDDRADTIAQAFQTLVDKSLPEMVNWATRNVVS